ncbi:MAG TPA: hypothetical protein PKK10_03645 [Woeseiaceae bacterium]|nr:hypothetical protein [Woeseiaceae bacterium]
MQKTLIVLFVVLIAVWLYWRRRQARSVADSAKIQDKLSNDQGSRYHAVAIRYSQFACAAARDIEGHRFLASTAPRLPLPGCDRDSCDCRFQHYDDRRSGHDRRSPFASGGLAASTGKYEQERRQGDERRLDDQDP